MPARRLLCSGAGLCLVLASPAWGQDLDPRAYVHVPVNGTFLISGLVNLGTNRWAFQAGIRRIYPGTLRKTQSSMGAFQAHMSYNITRRLWAALDVTYYMAGRIIVEGVAPTDMQSNMRAGGHLPCRSVSATPSRSRGALEPSSGWVGTSPRSLSRGRPRGSRAPHRHRDQHRSDSKYSRN
jgi:hypothetical protein